MNRLKKSWSNSLTFVALLGASIVSYGCGDPLAIQYEKLGLVEVSGTVKLDGQPLQNCTVYFEESESLFSSGVTDTQGRYQLMFDSRKSGVTKGEKTVRFKPGAPPSEKGQAANEEEDPDAKPAAAGVSVPDCYNKDSKLKVTVSASDSSFDFDLKSDCSTTGKLGG